MEDNKYKNIRLTENIEEANCVTHSGRFHIDDVISTLFISNLYEEVVLIRLPTVNDNIKNKLIYDIGLGKYDHHQKDRNGKRENGIFYSSIGLLWKDFGREYLRKIGVSNIEETFEYIDKELIQYIDATDNMQMEYLENKISPDFIKLCNPEWNEEITEKEAFIKALKLADEFWKVYIKHAIAEVEAIKMITKNIKEANDCYLIYEKELPYRKAIKMIDNNKVKYIIFKSRREGYDVRTIIDSCKFKDEIINAKNIDESKIISGIEELIYVDNHGKLCCTKTLEGAIKLIKYNEN